MDRSWPINCAALPEHLLESELFGHEKGAFTGADRRRIGKFEQCSGGTLFLDEIGAASPLTQSKMLRILQDQSFERLGGNETIRTDVRVLAATNINLESAVAAGDFRHDLYYRLSVFTIHLPPLRVRGDDLKLLTSHYLRRFNRELGKDVQGVAPETLELLRRYPWPGNVRELQSVLKQALLQAAGPVLVPDFLPASVSGRRTGGAERVHGGGDGVRAVHRVAVTSGYGEFVRRGTAVDGASAVDARCCATPAATNCKRRRSSASHAAVCAPRSAISASALIAR